MFLSEIITLETNRLILKTPQLADIEAMMIILNDIETMQSLRYMTIQGNEWTIEKTRERIENQIHRQLNDEGLFFHIYDKNTNQLMGVVALPQLDFKDKTGTSGIILYRSHWRKGFATEALLATLQYCFETLNLKLIRFYVMSSNKGMRSLFDKFGLNSESAELHKAEKHDNSTTGEIVYCLTDKTWPTIKKNFLMALDNPNTFDAKQLRF
ncbi:MAG: GNAT family N-acetyltransferase [Gammaproteobacteria bacterium]